MIKRSDGRYQEAITVDGIRHFFYGKTKAIVYEKMRKFKEGITSSEMFQQVADSWWEEHEPSLEQNTIKSYVAPLRRAKDAFHDVPISEITAPMVQSYLNELVKKKYARKTVSNHLLVLNLILSYAVVQGYMETNPAREVSISRKLKSRRRDIASDKDIDIVKKSYDVPFGDVAYWALYTGCRKGELLALTWDDIDLNKGLITISKSVYFQNGKPFLKQPKTDAGTRQVPILRALEEKIKPGKGVIFKGPDGGMLSECQFRKRWDRYVKATGISCTLHQLRHAFATMLYENGIDVLDAQQLLGHANASTTQDIYTHIRNSRQEQIRKKLYNANL